MPTPDRMERVETSSGCMLIMGVPLLTFGVFLAVAPLLGEPGLSEGVPPALLITVPFGLLFTVVGMLLILGRWGMEIDRGRGSVVRWWGVVWPIRRAERRLDEFDRVVLSEEVTEVGGHENLTYAVRLAGDGTPMDLQHTVSPDAARLEAEAVARYADLPLHDETADEAVVRAASELDESVRERALREGARPDPGPPSEGSAVRCHVDADALVVELPRWRLGMAEWWAVVVFFIAWVVPVSVILAVQSERVGSDAAGVIFFSVLAFFFLLVPVVGLGVALLRHLTTRETLLVCPHVVELERRSLFGRREFDVSTAELEEVRCMPECLRLVTDRIAVEVGVGLEPEDLRWLQALVLAVATASDTRS